MGAAVKGVRGKSAKSIGVTPRKHTPKSPLDRASGWELVWSQVAPLFDAARRVEDACFVYFIGEEGQGAIKIGSAKDPVLRLRGLQTGNPRRLQIEHVLVGRSDLERLLHGLWEPFAVRSHRGKKVDALPGTEWFTADIRPKLEPILKTAAKRQVKLVAAAKEILPPEELERVVREAHAEHGFEFKGRDEIRLPGATVGTVVRRRSRI